MHRPILEGLEEFLSGSGESDRVQRLSQHLAECGECRRLVDGMRSQSAAVRSLRAPEEVEPAPGFYARVIDRIEAQSRNSLWSVFLEPLFAKRLVFASLALFALLASAVWTSDPAIALHEANPVGLMAVDMPHADGVDPQRDRNVVFVQLATYGGEGGELQLSSD
jgi:anti-sigma factor RsiW